MYQHIYKVPVRSEWSEFSLRTRPPKIRRFQAGFSNTSDDEDIASLRRKTERNLRQTKPVLRNENTVEDSIEYDVFTIAMSYPEGRQRMLERLDASIFGYQGNKESSNNELLYGKNTFRKKNPSKRKLIEKSQVTKKDANKKYVSKITAKSESEKRELLDDHEDQSKFGSVSQEQNKPQERSKERSKSPELQRKHGRRKFTTKEHFEKRPPKFSLRDILGKDPDGTETYRQVDNEERGYCRETFEGQKEFCSASQNQLNIDDSFTDNMDAWIEEFGNKGDNSLLAMLESSIDEGNNHSGNMKEKNCGCDFEENEYGCDSSDVKENNYGHDMEENGSSDSCDTEENYGDDIEESNYGDDMDENNYVDSGDTDDSSYGGDTDENNCGGDLEDNNYGVDMEKKNYAGDTGENNYGGDMEESSYGDDIEENNYGGDMEENNCGCVREKNSSGGDVKESNGCVREDNNSGGDVEESNYGGNMEENNYSGDTEEEDDADARYYYENMLNPTDQQHGDVGKFWLKGSLVWGRLSKTRWWPAVVIDGPMAGQKIARIGWTWVMWFGDHKISQIRQSQVVSFAHQFREHCRGKLSSALENAIIEALKVSADRAGVLLEGYINIKRWGLLEMGFLNIVEEAGKDVDPFLPKEGSELPPLISKELRKLRNQAEGSDSTSDEEPKTDLVTCGCFESEVLKDVDFCLSCAKHDRKIVCEHPLFVGFVCGKCKDSLMESLLALDDDGCNLFCAVCGEGGELYVCEEKDCGRSFCVRCMKHYLSHDALKLVRGRTPWLCFLCTKYSSKSHGVLVPRDRWQEELIKFFNPMLDQVSPSCDPVYFTGRKLRVLSLFDGIGCVRVALEQLQLDVEVYYASETDANAQHLTMFNHGFSILHLGELNSVTKDRLQEICPIDLVVARPPSEDLDVTNREYEGFNGTGMMVLKVLMILKDIELLCKGSNSVYWLVETTAAIKSEYRKILSDFFQKEPCMWDAQFFSPYVSPKLYWGNIPKLYSSLQYYRDIQMYSISLESCLAPNVNRSARVKKLRNCAIDMPVVGQEEDKSDEESVDHEAIHTETLISDTRARADSSSNTMYSLPVSMNGKKTNIWIGEVEKVLGLPLHYTDVSRLSLSQRQKLLKHAPNVRLIKHLLSPLTEIFLTFA